MDEGNVDADNSRLQIKKLKEKVKTLVSEVDLSHEIRSEEFRKTFNSKQEIECNINDISSELEPSDEDSDEFLDIAEAEFISEANWLVDRNSNCNTKVESSNDIFNVLYSEVDEYHADMSDLYYELQLLRNSSPSSVDSKRACNRNSLIDSRTFTRPKKYSSRPPLLSVVSNFGDDGREGKIQRRLTGAISSKPNLTNKIEDLSKVYNRTVSGTVNGDKKWEEGSEEGLADVENSRRKINKKTLPASIIDRLQELKRSNSLYVCSRTLETKQLNAINGNVEEPDRLKVSQDANKVKAALDSNVKNPLSASYMSDILKNIPEYFSDDNESFFSLDEVSGFCDRLTLSTDPNTYSSIVREMEQNEICFYHGATPPENAPLRRMTFGGLEIPVSGDARMGEASSLKEQLLEVDSPLNRTYHVLCEPSPKLPAPFEIRSMRSPPEISESSVKCDAGKKQSAVDVILHSDIVRSFNPNYSYKNCDNKSEGDGADDNFNETYTRNELNKIHSERYTTKVFDASFRRTSVDKCNGKKDHSDQSEDDCMSTTSDNSYRSADSNSELKNIEELKNIAMQQNKKLSDIKASTPKLENSQPAYSRSSDEWKNFSPIRKNREGGSQASSNSSSRGPSPKGASIPSPYEVERKARTFSVRQPPKVPQRELKLKAPLIRPTQNIKKAISIGGSSTDFVVGQKSECKTAASVASMPILRPSITPVPAVSSSANPKPVTRIPSGIPRPPSRLKRPEIRFKNAMRPTFYYWLNHTTPSYPSHALF